MTKPTLSIIIPAYNCSGQIGAMVNSILRQPFDNFELIIINDESTDHTAEVLQDLSKSDKRIKIINLKKNGGASVARNAGIKASHGQYLMFLDADDEIKPGLTSSLIKEISKKDVDLALTGFTIKTFRNNKVISSTDACTNRVPKQKDDESFKLYILHLLGLDGRLYQVWNKIYRANIIKNNNLQFKPGINFGEDLVFNLNYYACMSGRISFIYKPLYIYNQSLDSGTFSKSSLIYANRQANYDELLEFTLDIPASDTKSSLLTWIRYNWLYSHMLAVGQAPVSYRQKLKLIRETAQQFGKPIYSDPDVIGKKRYQLEKLFYYLINHPHRAITFIKISNTAKNCKLTSRLWQKVKGNL